MKPICYNSAKLTARSAASIAAANGDLRDLGYYQYKLIGNEEIDSPLFFMEDKNFRYMVDLDMKISVVWENDEPDYQSHDDCLESWSYRERF